MSTRPLLLRYAIEASNPGISVMADDTVYDSEMDVLVHRVGSIRTPIVLLPDYAGRVTKKADIEKGEDQKDAPRPPKPSPPPGTPRPEPTKEPTKSPDRK